MESGLRDRNNSTREILTRLNDWVSMESGLRDRNNLWEKVATYCINDVSQWSPVLETGTIRDAYLAGIPAAWWSQWSPVLETGTMGRIDR